ncbi:MAG: hypothetical protein ACOC70_01400 [bacterium]
MARSPLRLAGCLALSLAAACAPTMPSGRFAGERVTVNADLPAAEGKGLAERADAFVAEVSRLLNADPPSPQVYVFESGWDLRAYLRRECSTFSERTGACFETGDGRLVVAVRAGDDGEPDPGSLRHELTHAVIGSNFTRPMPWLDEGLAQCFADHAPPREPRRLLQELASTADIEERVVRVTTISRHEDLDEDDYRVAWGLTWYLIQDGGYGWRAIRRCLGPPAFGETPADRVQRCLGLGPSVIARSFELFLRDYRRE